MDGQQKTGDQKSSLELSAQVSLQAMRSMTADVSKRGHHLASLFCINPPYLEEGGLYIFKGSRSLRSFE